MSHEIARLKHHVATFDDDGSRMHNVEAGDGEPVRLLHGFPETWFAWRKIMPALAVRFRVIAPA